MSDPTSFLNTAFPLPEHEGLKDSIRKIIAKNKSLSTPVFTKISNYIQTLHSQIADQQEQLRALQAQAQAASSSASREETNAPSPKKRKLDNTDPVIRGRNGAVKNETAPERTPPSAGEHLLTITDLSFSVPLRKKLTLLITTTGLSAITPSTGNFELSVTWSSIRHIALLPQPDRATPQNNLVIFPEGSEGLGADSNSSSSTTTDAIVFTLPSTPPKTASGPALSDSNPNPAYDTTSYTTLLTSILTAHLPPHHHHHNKPPPILQPTQSEFLTTTKKGYITTHRGSKEGHLFLLSTGILFAFKKPLLFFEFANIDSISYTSITKRTFNLNIHVSPNLGGGGQEIEFSMIDQAEYSGIDTYVKRHGLNDRSMAEQRRAVKYNVNKTEEEGEDTAAGAAGAAGGGGANGGEMSDLQKALEDAEDEEEEDYDPGSEGESDGSGSSSEDDDEGGADDDDDDDDDEDDDGGDVGDLREELGSELEDAEISEEAPVPVKTRAKAPRGAGRKRAGMDSMKG